MKNFLFILTLLIIAKTSISQEYFSFPDSNAIWNEVVVDHGYDGVHYTFSEFEIGSSSDTLMKLGKVYHKVYSISPTGTKSILFCYREEKKKIYAFYYYIDYNTNEFLLYDFNLREGDSFNSEIVSKVDSVLISSHYRKRLYFTPGLHGAFWIEGIGSSKGLLGPATPIPTCKCNYQRELVCFYKGDDLIYHNPDYYSCSSKTDYVNYDYNRVDEISLYPNPVTNLSYLYFNQPEKRYKVVEFYSISGVKVKSSPLLNQERLEINRIDFAHGVYFYRLLSDEKICAEGKFVVQ